MREAQLERNATPTATPLNVCITNAGSEVAYQLASLVARGGVFEVDTPISLRLLASADRLEELEGTVMELADLASPSLAAASCTSSAQEAFSSACVVFVLDYPYEGVGEEVGGVTSAAEKGTSGNAELGSQTQESAAAGNHSEGEEKVFGGGDTSGTDSVTPSESQTAPGSEGRGREEGERSEGQQPQESSGSGGGGATAEGGGDTGTEGTVAAEKSQPHTESDQIPSQPEGKSKESEIENITPSESDPFPPDLPDASRLYQRYAGLLDYCAQKDVRVVTCGRFANTGAAIMAKTVTSLPRGCFAASSSLAGQQAGAIVSGRLGLNGSDVGQVMVWGRTCGRVLADLSHTRVQHFPVSVCVCSSSYITLLHINMCLYFS